MDPALAQLAGILHAISCQKPHAEDMLEIVNGRNPEHCYFFLEQNMAEAEEQTTLREWLDSADTVCKRIGHSPDDSLRIITSLLAIKSDLERLLRQYPSVRGLAVEILAN